MNSVCGLYVARLTADGAPSTSRGRMSTRKPWYDHEPSVNSQRCRSNGNFVTSIGHGIECTIGFEMKIEPDGYTESSGNSMMFVVSKLS